MTPTSTLLGVFAAGAAVSLGSVGLWIAVVCVVVVVGVISPALGLVAVLVAFVPYVAVSGMRHQRLRQLGLPRRWTDCLTAAIVEEEAERDLPSTPDPDVPGTRPER